MSDWPSAGMVAEVPTERNLRVLRRRGGELERRFNELNKEGLPASGKAGGVLKGEYPNPGFAKEPAYKAEIDNEIEARKEVDLILKGEGETEKAARIAGDETERSNREAEDAAIRTEIEEAGIAEPGDAVSLRVFGAESGKDCTTAFQAAAKALAKTGKTLYIPSGVWKLKEPVAVKGFNLRGVGSFDFESITGWGSVIAMEGSLTSTASHVFTLTYGANVEGIAFYYPGESVANSTPAITATGYVIRLENTNPRKGSTCKNNYLPGVPFAISNAQGWSEISYNFICATKVAIHDEEEFAEHQINNNQITVGLWDNGRNEPINAYIALNAIAFKLTKTLATFTDNTVFGYSEGYRFEGYAQFTHVCGGLVDGTRYGVRFINGYGPTDVVFTGVTFGCGVAANPGGVRDNYASLESNCFNIGKPGVNRANIHIDNCMVDGANGDCLMVSNTAASFPVNISITGGDWNNPGRFAPSHTMQLSGVSGTFTDSTTSNNGDVITGAESGAKATVRKFEGVKLWLDLYTESPAFKVGETITGSLSGAKATVVSVTRFPRYQAVRYTDSGGGELSFQSTHSKWEGYQWPAGIWMIEGGTLRVIGNAFSANTANAQNCIRVDKAERFVEMGNVSTIPGAVNKDLEVVGPVAKPTVTGSSSYSR